MGVPWPCCPQRHAPCLHVLAPDEQPAADPFGAQPVRGHERVDPALRHGQAPCRLARRDVGVLRAVRGRGSVGRLTARAVRRPRPRTDTRSSSAAVTARTPVGAAWTADACGYLAIHSWNRSRAVRTRLQGRRPRTAQPRPPGHRPFPSRRSIAKRNLWRESADERGDDSGACWSHANPIRPARNPERLFRPSTHNEQTGRGAHCGQCRRRCCPCLLPGSRPWTRSTCSDCGPPRWTATTKRASAGSRRWVCTCNRSRVR